MINSASSLPMIAAFEARCQRIETPIPGGHMVWRRWGSGPAVALLHGGHGSWLHWIANIEAIGADHTLLLADMPNYGDSDALPRPVDLDALADAVSDGLDHLLPGGERFTLGAFSFGATVAGAVALRQQGRMDGLMLVGPAGLGLTRPPMGAMVNWKGLTGAALIDANRHNLGTLMLHDPARIDEFAVHQQIVNSERTRFRSRDISHTDVLKRALGGLALPLACLWGEEDATSRGSFDKAETILRARDPEAVIAVVAGAGHWVQYERPEAFNPLCLAALRSLALRSALLRQGSA